MHLEMTLAAKTASWLFMPYDSMYFLEILVDIGSGTPCDRNMTRNLTELCIGSSHVFYLSKQVGATFKFPTWTRIERRIRNRARRRRLWYFDKLLQTIWMSSVSSLWRTFFFLRKSSVAGSLQCCSGSVASVLHSDIIVVLNAKVRFDLSFIYKSWHNPRQRCTMHSWSSVSLWNVELGICWIHEAFVMHRDFTVWSFSRSHTASSYSVVF